MPRLRPLLRQRTRWAQGNLQALGLLGAMWRSPFPRRARIGEALYLLMPLWQTIVGSALLAAIALAALGLAAADALGEIVPEVYVLGFSNAILGCLATRHEAGWRGWIRAIVVAHLYALYSWRAVPRAAAGDRPAARNAARLGADGSRAARVGPDAALVSGEMHSPLARGRGRGWHTAVVAFALTAVCVAPASAAELPPLPHGWPKTLQIGLTDPPGDAKALHRSAPFGMRYQYLAGGVNTGSGWSTWNPDGSFVSMYVAESRAAHEIPVFSYYQLLQSKPGGEERRRPTSRTWRTPTRCRPTGPT